MLTRFFLDFAIVITMSLGGFLFIAPPTAYSPDDDTPPEITLLPHKASYVRKKRSVAPPLVRPPIVTTKPEISLPIAAINIPVATPPAPTTIVPEPLATTPEDEEEPEPEPPVAALVTPTIPQPIRHTGPIPWKNASSFSASDSASISFSPRSSWMIFLRSSPPTISSKDGSPVTVYDIDGKQVYSGASGETLPSLSVGHYFVENARDRSQFFIMPDDYTSTSFLGSNIPARTDGSGFAMPGQSFRASRFAIGKNTSVGYWERIQIGRDEWDWTEVDARMKAAGDFDQILLINSETPPDWVTDEEIIDQFVLFAQTIVARYTPLYPGKIKYVEILNEPWCCGTINNGFFDHLTYVELAGAYTELVQKASQAIKSIDPSILIVGPAMQFASAGDLQHLAAAGIGQYLDGISWHEYRLGMDWPDEIDSNGTRVDILLKDMHSLFPGKELIIDEIGFTGLSAIGTPYDRGSSGCGEYGLSYGNWRTDSWHVGMNKITKMIVMLRAGGVSRISTHIFNLYNPNCAWVGWETGAPDSRGIKPQSSAYLMTGYWLNDADFVQEKVLDGSKIFLYAWKRGSNSFVFAWTVKNHTAPLRSIPNTSFTDVFGNPASMTELSEQPTIIRSPGIKASELINLIEDAL